MVDTIDDDDVGIIADTIVLPHLLIGRNIQLPLGNLTVFIRVKNMFGQHTDFALGKIEVEPEFIFNRVTVILMQVIQAILEILANDYLGTLSNLHRIV